MNANWKPIKLGEVLKLEYGKPLEDRNPEGKYPVYGANGEKTRTDKFYYDKPSIIVGRKGSAGEVNLTENKFWALDVTYFVTFDDSKYDLKFLYNLLLTLELPKLAKGVKPGINRNEVYDLDVSIPSLAEQQRIVAILDEAFAAIAQAKQNAEKNLQNARELFDSYLQSVFANPGDGWEEKTLNQISITFGRGKSKHRPRNDKKLYGGEYPFIQTGDIRNCNHFVTEYSQTYNEIGLAQSKLWKKGTICITIAANIAETGILGFDACFPDSVIGIEVNPERAEISFVEYLLQSFKTRLQAKGKGSAQANINLGTFENELFPFPSLTEQKAIVSKLLELSAETQKLENIYRQKINDLDELKKSILQKAFSGELTAKIQVSNVIDIKTKKPISATDLQAGIVATAYQQHQQKGNVQTFGHVKAEKIVHLTESILELDLEREPIKDAAGPNDYSRLLKVESRAAKAGFFRTEKKDFGYSYTKGSQFEKLIENTKTALSDKADELTKLIDLFVPMNTQQAELVATVYAAWNNLLIDNLPITDEAIVTEARENWHEAKLKIERERFFKTINWMKENNLIPKGKGKKVSARSAKA